MPDIDPAALTRQGSSSLTASTPTAAARLSVAPSSSQKQSKTVSMGQRIDLEPLYMALKSAIGEYWVPYKEATSLFILGQ